jgi:hypothetical protein
MTQDDLDTQVDLLCSSEVKLASIAATMRRQGDPQVSFREDDLMLLQNCLVTLKFYDVTSLLLTDAEIETAIQLGTSTILKWTR